MRDNPIAPKVVTPDASDPASCTIKPYVEIPATPEGEEPVKYTLKAVDADGKVTQEGPVEPGKKYEYGYGETVTVKAEVPEGRELAEGAKTEWSWKSPAPAICDDDAEGGNPGQDDKPGDKPGQGNPGEGEKPGDKPGQGTNPGDKPGETGGSPTNPGDSPEVIPADPENDDTEGGANGGNNGGTGTGADNKGDHVDKGVGKSANKGADSTVGKTVDKGVDKGVSKGATSGTDSKVGASKVSGSDSGKDSKAAADRSKNLPDTGVSGVTMTLAAAAIALLLGGALLAFRRRNQR